MTNGIMSCVCLTLAISVLQIAEVMSRTTQEESGEERVTAKSRPTMSLIARAPSTLSSSASESPGNRSYESQSPLSMQSEKHERTGQPVVGRTLTHQVTQSGMQTRIGLLRSGKLMN